jgi:dipeptidyl-peptidase 4
VTPVQHPPLLSNYRSPIEFQRLWWDADAAQVHLLDESRDYREVRLITIDAVSGAARERLTETGASHVELAPIPFFESPNVRFLHGGTEFIWYASRDGWGHLYRYAADSGELKNQITSGPWIVHQVVRVDEETGWVYFLAGGREGGRDPYLRHLYRVMLDGTGLTLLTPEDADHQVTFSPSGQYFVDAFSRVDLATTSILRSASGQLVCPLEEGDVTQLHGLGWNFPERFSVKARDGVTDLYGVIVRPTNYDPTRSYPVLDSIYPGPQITRTPRRFASPDAFGWLWQEQALAELGFIVVTIDGPGTPFRSKAFIDQAYGERFGEAGGLADHIAGLRQLAARDPSLDLNRVGIYGHSGGGYASARALMKFPDFYKVAVSSAGNHDQQGYIAVWGERYIGLLEGERYRDQSNYHLASNLRGKLLLAYGALDDNVPPTLTLQLVDSLIAANKDFDLLILPHCDHRFMDLRAGRAAYEGGGDIHPYFVRRRWDYFVRHLLGAEPPGEFEIGKA